MRTAARLRGLRLQGFKSFAEKTLVELGPGISAVVGPNGSGKSNLADALRWTLGEQGRSLRIRRSEDVIWAGSERRSAQGMADVSLLIDNADGLLPVEYAEIELGRRLYRSGENDYLLNRQRVRLRDLVDLLDAAHLADNAFLFIGQGMVDQALALRPEERRPLFEEVAGVRRHERRRRRAEEQLAESEANLARAEDILAELRPQARRLAVQAEQQASRASAGDELAAAILLSTHGRWHEAAARAAAAAERRSAATADADAAAAALAAAEDVAGGVASDLAARAEQSGERQAAHDAARTALEAARLREARLASELASSARERDRLVAERDSAAAEAVAQRRELARPDPERDLAAEAELGEAERALADALAELAEIQSAANADEAQRAALRRAAAASAAEAETVRRRAAEAARRADEARAEAAQAEDRRAGLEAAAAAARASAEAARAAERDATSVRERAAARAVEAEARRAATAETVAGIRARSAAARERRDALAARLEEDESRGIARAARRRGGRRVDEDLVVEPTFVRAVERALGDLARAYVVAAGSVEPLAAERGHLVVADAVAGGAAVGAAAGANDAAAPKRGVAPHEPAARVGGGPLAAAVRRDPTGAATALLSTTVWVPDLGAAMAIQETLLPGWAAVTVDGAALVTATTVSLGADEGPLERRAELVRLTTEVDRLADEVSLADGAATEAAKAADAARATLSDATAVERRANEDRRMAEEGLALEERALESAIREGAWQSAQADRLASEAERLASAVRESAVRESAARPPAGSPGAGSPDAGAAVAARPEGASAVAAWQARADELRTRRDRLASAVAARDAERRAAEQARARAEAASAIAAERAEAAERSLAALGAKQRGLVEEMTVARADVAASERTETAARAALDELRAEDAAGRERLREAEAAVHAARERLRLADERLRAADVADLEARLGLESLKEGALVDLAALGELGIRHLSGVSASPMPPQAPAPIVEDGGDGGTAAAEDDPAALERAFAQAADSWAVAPPDRDPPPPAVLARLRRRYHELGAGNPFAVEEYAEVKARLEALETQATDLRDAIGRTRRLIEELDAMIAGQFATTFRALEAAFDARFQQLFGGGFARLTLTEPDDLAATGVEIVARPPGKKPQALAMLSGGERALTAVALLFAMLEVRPVPFCVLDEVDAALDEANIGRFTEALRALADRIQFIVITHNRGTIESADALYGVTVGDDSVSRVISLRLEEARELAERRTAALVGAPA